MGKSKSVAGKKRNATSNIQSKPAKSLKKTSQPEKKANDNDLFDNLEEEMDEEEMEKLVKQLNDEPESESEEEEQEEVEFEEEEEEYEPNEFDDIDFDEKDQKEEKEPEEEDKMEEEQPVAEEKETTFRDLYMSKVTQAFGSDLDTIRQEPNFNATRLNILIDSLEAGIDIFSKTEQEIILADEKK